MVAFPSQLTIGETLTHELDSSGFLTAFVYLVGPQKIQLNYVLTGNIFKLSSNTDAWLSGAYAVELWRATNLAREIVDQARLTLLPSIFSHSTTTAYDPRSRAERMIEKIEAMLEGNASEGVRRYRINNRELERYSISELVELLNYWKNLFQLEVRKSRGVSALGPRIAFNL